MARGFDYRYEGVKGTPFLNENFQKGKIELTLDKIPDTEANIRFDAYFHQFQVQMPSGVTSFIKPSFIKKVTIENEGTYLPIKADKLGKKNEIRYCYSVYEKDDIQILKMPYKRFLKADYKQAYNADIRYDEFGKIRYEYFLHYKDDYQKFRPKKKSFLQVLPAHLKAKVEKYAKSKKLDLNSDADFMDALKNGI